MEFVADLHLHSRFSRATAKNLDLEHIYQAAQLKGITLVGTGDFTHPKWFEMLSEKLEPAEPGLFKLKSDIAGPIDADIPERCRGTVRFILQCEISSIYKKENRVRKNHNLIFLPDLETVKTFNARLDKIGNITSDGRPILGLDAEKLLEIMLETSDEGFLIPAHIWTPWFSMFGSKSGFDTIEACFGSLSSHIFAVETGLSSDPPMNWRVADLDRVALISSSDAHSPMYMGRNASRFDTALSFFHVRDALKSARGGYLGTIDMYPEEGKYHFDGHRNCQVALHPSESRAYDGICPECGKPMTLGVLYRVQELASRDEGYRPERCRGFERIVPLAEMLSELCGVGPKTKKVTTLYNKALKKLGPELDILLKRNLDEIDGAGIPLLADAMARLRSGKMHLTPGYDGEFGSVKLFSPDELTRLKHQLGGELFPLKRETKKREVKPKLSSKRSTDPVNFSPDRLGKTPSTSKSIPESVSESTYESTFKSIPEPASHYPVKELNLEQQQAINLSGKPLLMEAGPGTGKTHTLTEKIATLILDHGIDPGSILALTFTNKAASEMQSRIKNRVNAPTPKLHGEVTASTFHRFCLDLLKRYTDFPYAIADETLRLALLGDAILLTFPDGVPTLQKKSETQKGSEKEKRKPSLAQVVNQVNGLISLKKRSLHVASEHDSEHSRLTRSPSSASITKHAWPNENSASPVHEKRKDFSGKISEDPIELIQRCYGKLLERYRLIEMDDLVPMVLSLLERDQGVLTSLTQRFTYIFVDEYQDINQGQYQLIKRLSGDGRGLCVIGDPDQSIYGFRGSDHRYFNHFENDYPHTQRIVFKRNYRSTETILQASFQLIRQGDRHGQTSSPPSPLSIKGEGENSAKRAHSKEMGEPRDRLYSDIEGVQQIQILEAATEKAEAVMIGKTVEQLVGGLSMLSMDAGKVDSTGMDECSFSDIAVLYRTRQQSEVLAAVFEKAGIPFQTADRNHLMQSPGIRELIAFIRLALHRGTFYDLEILMDHFGLAKGKKTRRQLKWWFYDREISPIEALQAWQKDNKRSKWATQLMDLFNGSYPNASHFPSGDKGFQIAPHGLRPTTNYESFDMAMPVNSFQIKKSVDLIHYTVNALKLSSLIDADERNREIMNQMVTAGERFTDPLTLYEHFTLKSDPDILDEGAEKVKLMTMHAAKGLEFKVVFIAGCDEGLTPYHRPGEPCEDLNEERRLFYVAMTRAEQMLYLCSAKKRIQYGQRVETNRSRFLDDIEETLKAYRKSRYKKKDQKKSAKQLALF